MLHFYFYGVLRSTAKSLNKQIAHLCWRNQMLSSFNIFPKAQNNEDAINKKEYWNYGRNQLCFISLSLLWGLSPRRRTPRDNRVIHKVRKTQHQNPEFGYIQGKIQKNPAKKYISIQQGMKLRKPSILLINWVPSCLSFFLSASIIIWNSI